LLLVPLPLLLVTVLEQLLPAAVLLVPCTVLLLQLFSAWSLGLQQAASWLLLTASAPLLWPLPA
jgi:hypothetical protein